MEATVDRNATTEESEQGTAQSFYNKTTEEAVHRITLKYNNDLSREISCKFITRPIEKEVGQDFIFGRGQDADILLNDSKMPRKYISIFSQMKDTRNVVFFLKNCTSNKVIPFKIHQKDTQHVGPDEEKELQNGTKFKLRDVKFTFYADTGDLDSRRVELAIARSDELGTDMDPSWYDHVGSGRPPGVETTNAVHRMNGMQSYPGGWSYPHTMLPSQVSQVHPPPLSQGHPQAAPVFGAQCYSNQPFGTHPVGQGHNQMYGSFEGHIRPGDHGQGQYQVRGPFGGQYHSSCLPQGMNQPPGPVQDQYQTGFPTPGQYPCQSRPHVNPGNICHEGTEAYSNPDKSHCAFVPSPTSAADLDFPFTQHANIHNVLRHPGNAQPTQMQQHNLYNHVNIQQGMNELQTQGRPSLGIMSCPHTNLQHSQQTVWHPDPRHCLGIMPRNDLPKGPALDALGSQPGYISDFSAMRL